MSKTVDPTIVGKAAFQQIKEILSNPQLNRISKEAILLGVIATLGEITNPEEEPIFTQDQVDELTEVARDIFRERMRT